MSQKQEESVECFAFVPIQKFKAMEQKIKKAEMAQAEPPPHEPHEPPEPPASATLKEEVHSVAPSQPDLKNTFRTAQMKKLFHLIQNNNPSQDITTLDNLDELIKSALGNGRKKLVNEEKFYRFLFEYGLSHFVKNTRAIDLYYDHKDSWWEV